VRPEGVSDFTLGVTAFKGTIRKFVKVFAVHSLGLIDVLLIDALVALSAPTIFVSMSLYNEV
jgi:hypothetical protein